MKRLSDEELVIRTIDGEKEAFSILVERYQNQIFSLAYRLGGDYDEARDMAQEAFLRVYQELRSFDGSRKFFPWLYRVAHNTCLNHLGKKPKPMADIDEIAEMTPAAEPTADPSLSYEEQERKELIRWALAQLPEQYAVPVFLKYMEGFSYQEIAEKTGASVSAIESRLYRGRQMLQKILKSKLDKG